MDALVFFAVSMVISSAFVSQALREGTSGTDLSDADLLPDPSPVLAVLLRTSIGSAFVLDYGKQVVVGRETTVGEALAVEAWGLSTGVDAAAFGELNREVLYIAGLASGDGVVPHVWIMMLTDEGWVALAEIEDERPVAPDTRAASFDLPYESEERCMVTLVLELAPLGP